MPEKRVVRVNNQGFTLLELLICMGIATILGILVSRNLITSSSLFQKTSAEVNLSSELQRVTDSVSDDWIEGKTWMALQSGRAEVKRYLVIKSNEDAVLYVWNSTDKILKKRSVHITLTKEQLESKQVEQIAKGLLDDESSEAKDPLAQFATVSSMVTSFQIQDMDSTKKIDPLKKDEGNHSNQAMINVTCAKEKKQQSSRKQVYLRNWK